MQWTNENGGAYGEDPYGGGYAYGYGYEYGGSATIDTATTPWGPAEVAHSAQPTSYVDVVGPDPYATRTNFYVMATDPYAVGPGPATTGWDAPHGDVFTVPPAELHPSGPAVPGPDTPKSGSVGPVFVDSSGRRQRRVLRAARLLVIPAGGYVALLVSTVLGGPSVSAPFVPQPDSPHPTTPRATAPDVSPGTGHSAGNGSPTVAPANSRPTPTRKSSDSTDRSATSVPTAAATGVASSTPTPPDRNPTSKGRAIGSSHNPVK
ncbi:hypothetical protein [Streptomyces chiangmaiensis]|uniref:Uncharacterized protein n=1 Tax=Streptomyces chiangmaiensis TaxID=766497 RepID=A0ABU7FT25_9ACTN|nr:hypothetical protein [Streptomyces chiangmaiensis]MED7827261.1 hypothetical protein [Streptomyces chiangmaiensis]